MTDIRDIIALLVAPVVMISACGLLCLAIYNRMAAVVGRARVFLKERFDAMAKLSTLELESQASPDAHILRLRIATLDTMNDHIIRRAKLLRRSLMCLLASVICMLACSLTLGLSLLIRVEIIALVIFIVGVIVMAAGIVLAMLELRRALDPLMLEQDATTAFSEG
jgi:hypothetical protein